MNVAIAKVRAMRRFHNISISKSSLQVAVDGDDYKLAYFFLGRHPNETLGTSKVQTNMLLKMTIRKLTKSPWLFEFVKLLIDNNALDVDKHKYNGSGRTPLDEAITHGHWVVVKLLLENGANVNYIQTSGCLSPLMDAIFDKKDDGSNRSIAYMLIDHGADLTYQTNAGMTVLDACTRTARLDLMHRVISENPTDMVAFKKALDIAYTQSDVSKSELGELVMPRSMKKMNISPTLPILLRAIRDA
jgi:ankyrin repeat protein